MTRPSDLADPECSRCGGTGQITRVVFEREGMVPCPKCRPEDGL